MSRIGRPPFKYRDEVIVDILIFDLNLDRIARKYGISLRTVYTIAKEVGLDLSLRSRIMKQEAEKRRLIAKIDSDKKVFLDRLYSCITQKG